MMHENILESEKKVIYRENNLLKVYMKWPALNRQYRSHRLIEHRKDEGCKGRMDHQRANEHELP